MKNQEKTHVKSTFWLKTLKIVLTTAICTIAAYLICTYLITPQYRAQSFLQVGYDYLPKEYYDINPDTHKKAGDDINLASELKEFITNESTYERAAQYAGSTPNEIQSSISVSNENGSEQLIIFANGTEADKTQKMANAYAKALDDTMFSSLVEIYGGGSEEFLPRTNAITEANLPQSPHSPRTTLVTIITGIISAIISFIVFSKLKLFDSINILVFTAFTLLCIFPFYYLFINTISDNELVARGAINFYPQGIHFQNYLDLQNDPEMQIGNALKITVLRTVIGTGLMVFVSAWSGYLVTKKKMWKRSFWYRMLVITMYFNAGLIPWFMNMQMLGLKNNFLAYIIPGMVAPYNIILVKTYIESIPFSLEESAVIDGAGTSRVFFSIILPLSVPILATITIFGAVGNWNSFQDSLLLMSETPELFTLQHRLYDHINKNTSIAAAMSTNTSSSGMSTQNLTSSKVIKYTVSMVTIIPILLVYPIMQRFFVKGIMLGAVKG